MWINPTDFTLENNRSWLPWPQSCAVTLQLCPRFHSPLTNSQAHTALGQQNVCCCWFIGYPPKFTRGLLLTPLLSCSGEKILLTVLVWPFHRRENVRWKDGRISSAQGEGWDRNRNMTAELKGRVVARETVLVSVTISCCLLTTCWCSRFTVAKKKKKPN